jgi:energy-coupling factor transporter ATP-binding protein EcfA2
VIKDIYLEQINVSNGGKSLIEDSELMLAHGRRYGVVGRNGTGKTTFLRALVNGEIKGLPKHCQVLHVEQEVIGDDTSVLEVLFPSPPFPSFSLQGRQTSSAMTKPYLPRFRKPQHVRDSWTKPCGRQAPVWARQCMSRTVTAESGLQRAKNLTSLCICQRRSKSKATGFTCLMQCCVMCGRTVMRTACTIFVCHTCLMLLHTRPKMALSMLSAHVLVLQRTGRMCAQSAHDE